MVRRLIVLEGGGGWRDLRAEFQKKKPSTRVATDRFSASILGKQPSAALHENGNKSDSDSELIKQESEMPYKHACTPNVIDLTLSSPLPPMSPQRMSSRIEYCGSDDEGEV